LRTALPDLSSHDTGNVHELCLEAEVIFFELSNISDEESLVNLPQQYKYVPHFPIAKAVAMGGTD
jgi:hypothetical protein